MDMETLFTGAAVVFAVLKIGPIVLVLPRRSRLDTMSTDPFVAVLYFTSKLSGILGIAFALAASASAGRQTEAMLIAVALVAATVATFWSIAARHSGRFKGLIDVMDRRRAH